MEKIAIMKLEKDKLYTQGQPFAQAKAGYDAELEHLEQQYAGLSCELAALNATITELQKRFDEICKPLKVGEGSHV